MKLIGENYSWKLTSLRIAFRSAILGLKWNSFGLNATLIRSIGTIPLNGGMQQKRIRKSWNFVNTTNPYWPAPPLRLIYANADFSSTHASPNVERMRDSFHPVHTNRCSLILVFGLCCRLLWSSANLKKSHWGERIMTNCH